MRHTSIARSLHALAALAAALALAGAAGAAEPAGFEARVDALVDARMRAERTPGVAVAVTRGGRAVLAKGYGLADVENGVPVTPATIFQSGSVGKQFTAALMMTLVEEGRVGLDDPVSKHLPDAPSAWSGITLRHLLNHTSGLPDYVEGVIDYRRDYTERQLLELAYGMQPSWPPGARWSYSNTGYVVAGIVIGRVSGRFYGELLRERIFGPAGMKTARVIDESAIVPHRAAGYRMLAGELANQEWVAPLLNTTADGSLYLSLADLIAWDAVVRERRLLKASSWEALFASTRLNSGRDYPYGLGWDVGTRGDEPVQSHGGSWQGFRSWYGRWQRSDLGIIVLANSAASDPQRIAEGIAALYDPKLVEWRRAPATGRRDAAGPKLAELLDAAARDELPEREFAYVRAGFFPEVAREYGERLRAAGRREALEPVRHYRLGDDHVYEARARYERGTFDVRLGLAPDGRIASFAIRPATD